LVALVRERSGTHGLGEAARIAQKHSHPHRGSVADGAYAAFSENHRIVS
jgi:hypothetical protein